MSSISLYKTPEDYLLTMIERVQARGSKVTDFTIGSVTRTWYEGLAAGISTHSAVVEQQRLDSYLATATGDALDRKAADDRVYRKAAVAAEGTVKITRAAAGVAVVIPAGWGELVTVPAPGQPPVSYVTTEDASFSASDTTKTVAAVAVLGGTDANVSQGPTASLPVIAVNPVTGFSTDGGFVLYGPWTGGVNEETDDELRARVPIEVQGRVLGRAVSFLAGALSVPGVASAQVLQNGDSRLGGTVPDGTVEIYYKGAASLLSTVTLACLAKAVCNQTVDVELATAERVVVDVEVFVLAGADTAALGAAVAAAIKDTVNGTAVGQGRTLSSVVKAIHAISDVQALDLPFNDFRLYTDADNTSHDLTIAATKYADLADADLTVTVTELS